MTFQRMTPTKRGRQRKMVVLKNPTRGERKKTMKTPSSEKRMKEERALTGVKQGTGEGGSKLNPIV